jgi:hypothetical protein
MKGKAVEKTNENENENVNVKEIDPVPISYSSELSESKEILEKHLKELKQYSTHG